MYVMGAVVQLLLGVVKRAVSSEFAVLPTFITFVRVALFVVCMYNSGKGALSS